MKRYCQTLELRDDPELIARYVEEHQHVWKEVRDGIREVGILDMQIYIHGTHLFMICETVDDFDWIKDNERLASLPRQREWEDHMSSFQDAAAGLKSNEKWQMMERIFKL